MKKKLLMTATVCLLLLASMSMAEYVVTTADGNGADGGVSNDTNKQDTWLGGTTGYPEIRRADGSRAKAAIVRFDIGSGIGGDRSGATLSITETTGNRGRTINIYGLKDGPNDFWDEATLSYNTAPGLLSPELDGYITIDENEWSLVGTMEFLDIRSTGTTVITGSIDPNFIASDTNGAVSFLLYHAADDGGASDYYVALKENTDGNPFPTLTFPNARFATDPDPANGSTVLTSQSTLSWTNTEPNAPSGSITCDVYFGSDPNRLLMDKVVLTAPNVSSVAINTENFPNFGTLPLSEPNYYWIVDSYDSSSTPPSMGAGALWRFSVTNAPQISEHPADQVKLPGETAEFFVTIESSTAITYSWYKSIDNANDTSADDVAVGGNSDTLTLTNVDGSNEGYYYCKAVNSSGQANAAYSNTARLVVQRQVAHWTLDSLVSGQYEDSSGEGRNADPNNTNVTFVDGVNVAATNQAVLMNANSFASSGTWNPSYVSGEFTISFWMKWDGSTGEYQNILSKMDTWAADDMMFQLGVSSGNAVNIISSGGGGAYADSPAVGEWEFVAVTFSNGSATIYLAKDGDINFATSTDAFTQASDVNAAIYLGGSADGTQLFNGTLDDVQIFNYVKDPIAIADLYNEAVAQDFCLRQYGSSEFNLDVNNNCRIDMADFAEFAKSWLDCGLYPNCP